MLIKKEYDVGDDVWIYGVSITNNNKITKGKVISILDLSNQGYAETHYVIAVPTEIEPLLEIRTWHNISQDEKGPVGMFREINTDLTPTFKKIIQLGVNSIETTIDEEDPTPDEIMQALEKSTEGLTHKPLYIKDNSKPKRKFYNKRKNHASTK